MSTVATFRWTLKNGEMEVLLRGPNGAVVQDLNKRADRVVNGAKRRCPVDMGRLPSSITKEISVEKNEPVARIGSNVEYAIFVHEGTGLFGPRHQVIRPKSAKFLVFTPRGGRATVFARQVRGVPPRPFLADALQEARG